MIPETHAGVRAGTRILLVEDNPDTAESLARLLVLFGYEVRIAPDGWQGLATAVRWQPEFVLLDLGLPGMDGYEVARRLRREAWCREPLLIAVTGYGQAEDLRRSLGVGIDHHLLKPVDMDVLLALLSSRADRDARAEVMAIGPAAAASCAD